MHKGKLLYAALQKPCLFTSISCKQPNMALWPKCNVILKLFSLCMASSSGSTLTLSTPHFRITRNTALWPKCNATLNSSHRASEFCICRLLPSPHLISVSTKKKKTVALGQNCNMKSQLFSHCPWPDDFSIPPLASFLHHQKYCTFDQSAIRFLSLLTDEFEPTKPRTPRPIPFSSVLPLTSFSRHSDTSPTCYKVQY